MLACVQYKDGRGIVGVSQLLRHLVVEAVCWENVNVPKELEKVWRVFFLQQDKAIR